MTVTDTRIYGIPLAELPTYRRKPLLTKDQPTEVHDGVNYELLDEMYNFIKEHPQTWEQASWFKNVDTETGREKVYVRIETVEELNSCGSSFCFAGHIALREGFPSPPLNNNLEWDRKVINYTYSTEYIYESVGSFAAKRLGLGELVADQLFDPFNTLEDLRFMILALKVDPEISSWDLGAFRDLDIEGKVNHLEDIISDKV